jgi:hypothetical protein
MIFQTGYFSTNPFGISLKLRQPTMIMSNPTSFIDWSELQGKEARGVSKDVDLGEVNDIGRNFIVTQKGRVELEKFYIPKYLAQRYDGHILWFNVSEGELQKFKRTNPPTYEEYTVYRVEGVPSDIETRLRVAEA